MSTAETSQDAEFAITELEVRLRAPDGQAVRDTVLARLDDLSRRVADDVKSGLATADFTCAGALSKALSSACTVLARFPAKR
jgi:hypothetical protein